MAKKKSEVTNVGTKEQAEKANTENNGKKKTVCPISRQDFSQHARSVKVQIGDNVFSIDTKEFSTGSFGWFHNGKVKVTVNGVEVPCQLGLNLTAIGSKELPKVVTV